MSTEAPNPLARRMWRGAAVISLVVAGACGGDGDRTGTAAGPAEGDPTDGFVAYARCLRGHGLDVPDPEPPGADGRATAMEVPQARTQEEAAALEVCARLLPQGDQGERSDPTAVAEEHERFLAFARCMRDHGVHFPDPAFTPDGRMSLEDLPDPGGPRYAEAQEACKHLGGISVIGRVPVVSGRPGG